MGNNNLPFPTGTFTYLVTQHHYFDVNGHPQELTGLAGIFDRYFDVNGYSAKAEYPTTRALSPAVSPELFHPKS